MDQSKLNINFSFGTKFQFRFRKISGTQSGLRAYFGFEIYNFIYETLCSFCYKLFYLSLFNCSLFRYLKMRYDGKYFKVEIFKKCITPNYFVLFLIKHLRLS